jgi:hypothetical protein
MECGVDIMICRAEVLQNGLGMRDVTKEVGSKPGDSLGYHNT